MKRKLTYKKARELSIKKWLWIVDNWDYTKDINFNFSLLLKDIPKLKNLWRYCGWCDYYEKSGYEECNLNCLKIHELWVERVVEKDVKGIMYAIELLDKCLAMPKRKLYKIF